MELQLDLIPGGDVVVNWDVEGVGIIFPISNAGDFSEFSASIRTNRPDKPSAGVAIREKFMPCFFVADPCAGAYTRQFPDPGSGLPCFRHDDSRSELQGFRQADETHRQSAVLQNLTHLVIRLQVIGIKPNPLLHQEGIVPGFFLCLQFKAVQKLINDQIDLPVQLLEEKVDVMVAEDRDSRRFTEVKLRLPLPLTISLVGS